MSEPATERDDVESTAATTPSDATESSDRSDANAAHDADRPSTDDEAKDAPTETPDSVRVAHRAANERGARAKGEGQISGDPTPER